MKASKLIGPTLDVWVAIALGEKRSERPEHDRTAPGMYWLKNGERGPARVCPQYSENAQEAMGLIERFKPVLDCRPSLKEWAAGVTRPDNGLISVGFGPTAAIALCRAIVITHVGDEVKFEARDKAA
jgi:hypothetical protein